MNTVGQNTQSSTPTTPPARQIAGSVVSRISKKMIYVAIAVMVFVFICAAPLWIGVAWLGGTSDVAAGLPLVPIYASGTDAQIYQAGYATKSDASENCVAPRYVDSIWRNGRIAGYSCIVNVVDLD